MKPTSLLPETVRKQDNASLVQTRRDDRAHVARHYRAIGIPAVAAAANGRANRKAHTSFAAILAMPGFADRD